MAAVPPIWLIGCGNMAGAMLRGWLDAGEPADRFTAVRPSGEPVAGGVRVHSDLPAEPFGDAIVQLGFKPAMLADLATDLAALTGPETVIVSILAGVELATLRRAFPQAGAIVRALPNTPVALRKGAIALVSEQAGTSGTQSVGMLMQQLGRAQWFDDESGFDTLTALVGSGPAFVFRFIDALAEAAERLGLDAEQATPLALAMVEGAAALAAASDESPAILADRVASPKGTTREGLDLLDHNEALRQLIFETLEATARRSREIAEATRG